MNTLTDNLMICGLQGVIVPALTHTVISIKEGKKGIYHIELRMLTGRCPNVRNANDSVVQFELMASNNQSIVFGVRTFT